MTLRVGIVGAGNIFERGYAPALAVTDAVRVAAVTDLDAGRAASAAAATGAQAVGSVGELLATEDIDAVFVLTPTDTHADLAIAALEAGKHVLCEKPAARSPADARRMADAAARAGRRLMIGHTRRFDDRWIAIREQLASGRVGVPAYLYRSEHAWNGAPDGAWPWRDARSGGVLWDVGVHVAELFTWFLGTPPRTAYARALHAREESQHGGAPDAAVVTFDYGDALHAVMSVSWIHPRAWGPFYASMQVVGTRGKLEYVDRDAHPAIVVGDAIEFPRYSPLLSALDTAFRREVEHFAAAIASGAPFAAPLEDAIAAVDMVAAAERSIASGRAEAVRT
jgi:UDP-N-acetylglucosamine 3-dehydrogenase